MQAQTNASDWDLSSAIELLRSLSLPQTGSDVVATSHAPVDTNTVGDSDPGVDAHTSTLGDFGAVWHVFRELWNNLSPNTALDELEGDQPSKGVRWQDALDGADLEDNVEPKPVVSAASLRTQQRAARRARAKLRAQKLATDAALEDRIASDTLTDAESDDQLDRLRRSPDRRAVKQDMLGRKGPATRDKGTPPTSPSPPKREPKTPRRQWPTANPFLSSADQPISSPQRVQIAPRDGLSTGARKAHLIALLIKHFPMESKYLSNAGLLEPAFTPLNVSKIGIHCFVDISNIMIGFHDCLKLARDIPITTHIRRVPMCFHNFSLVLERGRPAAKRVVVGSDKFPIIQQAQNIGYEINILERVHKAKELTPRNKRHQGGNSGNSGVSSGSEMNTGPARHKWVEQGVDEILHLKILESLIDADRPSTIVLATGDAAEAEYSGGFMRMVERALTKGWVVELVSFKLNTSSAYKRKEFRARWGPMFKWVPLDTYVEQLVDTKE